MKIIKTDRYDHRAYSNALDLSTELPMLLEEGEKVSSAWGDLQEDIFQNQYQVDPEIVSEKEPNRLARKILEEVRNTQEYVDLRSLTVGDLIYSSMATNIIGHAMINHIPEELAERHDLDKDLDLAKAYLDFAEKNSFSDEDKQTLREEIKSVEDKIDSLPSKLPDLDSLRQAFRSAAKEIEETLSYIQTAGDQIGENFTLSREAKKELGEKISKSSKLQKIFLEAGRITRIMQAKRSREIPERRQEVSGIRHGSRLEDVLPGEFALAGIPELKPLFLKRFAEASLQTLEFKGHEDLGSGPLILLIDGSGSMQGAREIWSKAIMWALARMAQEDKRDLCIMQFSHQISQARSWTFAYRTKPESIKLEDLIEASELFISGGTDFMAPLDWSVEQIRSANIRSNTAFDQDNPWEAADTILITDGIANLHEVWKKKFLEDKKELGFNVYAIGLQANLTHALEFIADQSVNLMDLAHDQEVLSDLFTHVS